MISIFIQIWYKDDCNFFIHETEFFNHSYDIYELYIISRNYKVNAIHNYKSSLTTEVKVDFRVHNHDQNDDF